MEDRQTNTTWVDDVYQKSVDFLFAQGWEGVKLDGCSQFHDTVKWAQLMAATGKPMFVEDCGNTHPPTLIPDPTWPGGECPYNWFRSSTDINPSWASIMNNLCSTTTYQDIEKPLSKPGCWAYPDMLEVRACSGSEHTRSCTVRVSCESLLLGGGGGPALAGQPCFLHWPFRAKIMRPSFARALSSACSNVVGGGGPDRAGLSVLACADQVGNMATFEEDRSHFGAWCVVSSPLILGYDVTNDNTTDKIWPIISNREAVAVNQQWAGHPGRLVKTWANNSGEGANRWALDFVQDSHVFFFLHVFSRAPAHDGTCLPSLGTCSRLIWFIGSTR
jgi:hypothetical protein